MQKTIIGLKELRENMDDFITKVKSGNSFTVVRRSQPVFKISPTGEENWEPVVDFTKIKKGGIEIKELLSRL